MILPVSQEGFHESCCGYRYVTLTGFCSHIGPKCASSAFSDSGLVGGLLQIPKPYMSQELKALNLKR